MKKITMLFISSIILFFSIFSNLGNTNVSASTSKYDAQNITIQKHQFYNNNLEIETEPLLELEIEPLADNRMKIFVPKPKSTR